MEIPVMERAQQNRASSARTMRARTGGPTLCVGGSQPVAERR